MIEHVQCLIFGQWNKQTYIIEDEEEIEEWNYNQWAHESSSPLMFMVNTLQDFPCMEHSVSISWTKDLTLKGHVNGNGNGSGSSNWDGWVLICTDLNNAALRKSAEWHMSLGDDGNLPSESDPRCLACEAGGGGG